MTARVFLSWRCFCDRVSFFIRDWSQSSQLTESGLLRKVHFGQEISVLSLLCLSSSTSSFSSSLLILPTEDLCSTVLVAVAVLLAVLVLLVAVGGTAVVAVAVATAADKRVVGEGQGAEEVAVEVVMWAPAPAAAAAPCLAVAHMMHTDAWSSLYRVHNWHCHSFNTQGEGVEARLVVFCFLVRDPIVAAEAEVSEPGVGATAITGEGCGEFMNVGDVEECCWCLGTERRDLVTELCLLLCISPFLRDGGSFCCCWTGEGGGESTDVMSSFCSSASTSGSVSAVSV